MTNVPCEDIPVYTFGPGADMEFVKCFTQVRFPTFLFHPRKAVNCEMFGIEFRNEDVLLLLYFEQITIFCNYLLQYKFRTVIL